MRDGKGAGGGSRCGELGGRLQAAEDVRLLEDHHGSVLGRGGQLRRVRRTVRVRDLDDLHAEARRVGLHDLADLRVQRLGQDDLRPAGVVARDEARVGRDGRAVVAGGVRDVHPGQLADRGLVLEDRLEHALAHLRLVRRVRGEQLSAREERVDDRRHVVVVDAHPEEAQLARRVGVPRGELLHPADERRLRERLRHFELAAEAARPRGSGRTARRARQCRSPRASPPGRRP